MRRGYRPKAVLDAENASPPKLLCQLASANKSRMCSFEISGEAPTTLRELKGQSS